MGGWHRELVVRTQWEGERGTTRRCLRSHSSEATAVRWEGLRDALTNRYNRRTYALPEDFPERLKRFQEESGVARADSHQFSRLVQGSVLREEVVRDLKYSLFFLSQSHINPMELM